MTLYNFGYNYPEDSTSQPRRLESRMEIPCSVTNGFISTLLTAGSMVWLVKLRLRTCSRLCIWFISFEVRGKHALHLSFLSPGEGAENYNKCCVICTLKYELSLGNHQQRLYYVSEPYCSSQLFCVQSSKWLRSQCGVSVPDYLIQYIWFIKLDGGRVFYDFSSEKLLLRQIEFHAVHLTITSKTMESQLC